jgi:acyl carrier protein
LINGYGPTESTTFTCCHLIKSSGARSIPIGRPLANTQIYVLDRNYQPAPVGVPGELYVGGDGLARGYLNEPEQTAEKFIPHLFSTTPGERLYRTGDLVRYLPSGELEFIRRVDQQVKIRGFRIEPGEIESVLARHPGVAECAVTAGVNNGAEKLLVAYVVAAEGHRLESGELRTYLREKLPDYMVPASFVIMDALPLTVNGKVDRQALPAAGNGAMPKGDRFVGPRTATEKTLTEIWARTLHIDRIGVADNFFELGGNSLTATRVMSRVRTLLNVELPLRALFESPTVEEFAKLVEKAEKSDNHQNVPAILPVSRRMNRES